MGYISFADFLEIPSGVISRLSAIRAADRLKELKLELMETKDKDARKKLNDNIQDIEKLFK